MFSQPVLFEPENKKKQRKCKYGERLPNGECPPKPKGAKSSDKPPVMVDLTDDDGSKINETVGSVAVSPVESAVSKTSIPSPVAKPPVAVAMADSPAKKKATKKQRPCKHGERLANGDCPPAPSKTTQKSRSSPKKMASVEAPKSPRYKNSVCTDSMTFEECEMAILRQSVIENEKTIKQDTVMDDDSREMIRILEDFLRRKKSICYGGTAINNILPENEQFYNRDVEMPDYDFYSKTAKEDSKELADIYFLKGFREVEVKSGVHESTYKVFVNFVGVADITHLDERIFDHLQKSAIEKQGILYSSPDFLRMSSYLELSRPRGDVSRWEKVFKRITLLNKYYPLKPAQNCDVLDFQRKMDKNYKDQSEAIFDIVKKTFIEEKVVFFGGFAFSVYADFFSGERKHKFSPKVPDFDVLSLNPKETAERVARNLSNAKFENIYIERHDRIGDLIPESYQITIGTGKTSDERDTLAFIYKPIACHSYNEITANEQTILVATINTILSFYLAFMFVNKWYYNKDRILCMSQYLFDLEQENRLEQTGPLKRFSTHCYGKQKTLTDMFSIKNEIYKRIGKIRRTPAQQDEYDRFFFKYRPSQNPRHTAIMNTVRQNPNIRETVGNPRASVPFVLEEEEEETRSSNRSKSSTDDEEETHAVYKPPVAPKQGNLPLRQQGPYPHQNRSYVNPNARAHNHTHKKKKSPPAKDIFSRIFY